MAKARLGDLRPKKGSDPSAKLFSVDAKNRCHTASGQEASNYGRKIFQVAFLDCCRSPLVKILARPSIPTVAYRPTRPAPLNLAWRCLASVQLKLWRPRAQIGRSSSPLSPGRVTSVIIILVRCQLAIALHFSGKREQQVIKANQSQQDDGINKLHPASDAISYQNTPKADKTCRCIGIAYAVGYRWRQFPETSTIASWGYACSSPWGFPVIDCNGFPPVVLTVTLVFR